ncbi:MAG: FAD-binding oxidoreductase [Gemmatimonadaceae bacterium]|nr:FAD-binding oxidoreductase [Gemmatimonadaceae bacterium]
MLPNVPLWDDTTWTPLPPLAGTTEATLAVVGLGGSGLAALRRAHELGIDAVGIDAGAVAGEAAGRNGGFLLAGMAEFHHDAVDRWGRERATALYRLTLRELERLVAESPESTRVVGSLRISDSADELDDCERQLAQMRADGLDAEWYEGPEGEGLHLPTDAVSHPMQRCRALATALLRDGVRLYEHTAATAIERGCVRTTEGEVRATHVLVCVDGALPRLFPELSDRVRPIRLQMLGTAPTRDVWVPRPVYLRYGYDYWQQLEDGRLVIGGGRDKFEAESETADAIPTDAVQHYLDAVLRARVGADVEITHRWAATVAYTKDYLPIAEEVRPGVWATGAYSGTGNVVGSMLARALVEQLTGRSARVLDLLTRDPVA